MRIEFDGSYPYDTDTVMNWWIGSDDFYRDIADLFTDQVDTFLTKPDQLSAEMKEALTLLLDHYEDISKGAVFDAYHNEQMLLDEQRRYG